MAERIRLTDPLPPMVRDTSAARPQVDPAVVAAALGAEPAGERVPTGLGPVARFAVRMELFRRLRPGEAQAASGAADRTTVALDAAEWADLQRLVSALAGTGLVTTPGQVAGALLSRSVRSALAELDAAPEPAATPLARDLTAAGRGA